MTTRPASSHWIFGPVPREACHGRGSTHPDRIGKGYGMIASEMCLNCHTSDKDLDWNFDRCWAIIKH